MLIAYFPRMKLLVLATVAIASVVGGPVTSEDCAISQDECPTLDCLARGFETEFGAEIPEGAVECLHGGDSCPWQSFEQFGAWFQNATDIQVKYILGIETNRLYNCWKVVAGA